MCVCVHVRVYCEKIGTHVCVKADRFAGQYNYCWQTLIVEKWSNMRCWKKNSIITWCIVASLLEWVLVRMLLLLFEKCFFFIVFAYAKLFTTRTFTCVWVYIYVLYCIFYVCEMYIDNNRSPFHFSLYMFHIHAINVDGNGDDIGVWHLSRLKID